MPDSELAVFFVASEESGVGEISGGCYDILVFDDDSKSPREVLLRSQLLLAEPGLRDGTFDRAVILLHQHTADGAAGLILNRPTGRLVGHYLKGEEFASLRHLAVHFGGPVTHDQLTFASFWQTPKKGLQWAMRISAEEAAAQARRPRRMVRAFLGYSGWESGQIEGELQRNTWFVSRPPKNLLGLEHDSSLWAHLMREISPLHRILAEAPVNAFLN